MLKKIIFRFISRLILVVKVWFINGFSSFLDTSKHKFISIVERNIIDFGPILHLNIVDHLRIFITPYRYVSLR